MKIWSIKEDNLWQSWFCSALFPEKNAAEHTNASWAQRFGLKQEVTLIIPSGNDDWTEHERNTDAEN